jgi:Circularly permutated YpsA SLOG family
MTRITIISGAQTGVDRAALDAAIACGLDYGGSIPCGRLAEDGPVSQRYTALIELNSENYAVRTRRNVRDADATLILCAGPPEGGTALTVSIALRLKRPVLVVDIDRETRRSAIKKMRAWINTHQPSVLNIAGPRESRYPGIYARMREILEKLFRELYAEQPHR